MVASSIIEKAFAERPDLKKRTYEAIAQSPQHAALFNDIATYAQTLRSTSHLVPHDDPPPSKKRKLDDAASSNGTSHASPTEWKPGYHTVPDTSFLVPQRKKLALEISPRSEEGLRARNPATGAVEFGVAWRDVQHAVCVPVPEKAQRQYAFCVFPTYGDGVTSSLEGASATTEPMVWTVPDTVPKNVSLGRDGHGEVAQDGTYKGYVLRLLDTSLGLVGRKVVEPDEKEFASTLVHAHRKGERAFHVSAFRGSKDGFLFFLRTGILYAFKKPLLFFPLDAIDSVSYTSVLQRTFNLNITTQPPSSSTSSRNEPEDRKQDFEFSMLDQADFAGIDAYVKRHGLQDASMAEQRRAKRVNGNGAKGGEGGGEGSVGEGEGELERARKELAVKEEGGRDGDEEEEDEGEEGEDYDPGSEGESEGSGSSSEEEEGGDGGREGEDGGLMADELGSGDEGEEEL